MKLTHVRIVIKMYLNIAHVKRMFLSVFFTIILCYLLLTHLNIMIYTYDILHQFNNRQNFDVRIDFYQISVAFIYMWSVRFNDDICNIIGRKIKFSTFWKQWLLFIILLIFYIFIFR